MTGGPTRYCAINPNTSILRIWRRLGETSLYIILYIILTSGLEVETSSKMPGSSNITQARRTVQQLRIEASIERIKVSKASADLMHYCSEHAKYDPLLMGVPASENPFKDKKPCNIL
ncbi:hypothetical protein DPEC_G00057350 [Dallia pectoralis]|uniref:Uncharacterized protein n=1 Tax=Dallia pectoralis TaxID=75939 RepID=A0ACC2H6H7_DALPE|nr:hypothetical protein DPEC_G00057350 [Dallia pectoralis]